MSRRPNSFMPMFWADYLADTSHLTSAENGAYLLLIARYWVTGAPLADDDAQMRRTSRMSASEWQRSKATIAAFFQIGDGVWRHRRIDAELIKAQEMYAKRSNAGRKGNASRWPGDNIALAIGSQCDHNATAEGSQPQPQPPSTPPVSLRSTAPPEADDLGEQAKPQVASPADMTGPTPSSTPIGSTRGTRLPAGWCLSDENLQFAQSQGLGVGDASMEADKFRDYWRALPGAKGVKLDWDGTWRNWIRKAVENGPKRNGARHQGYVGDDEQRRRAGLAAAVAKRLGSGPGDLPLDEPA